MRPRAAIVTVVTLVVCVATAGQLSADTAAPNRPLSDLYTRYAMTALEEGRLEDARSFAETALEFDDTNADAHHLRAHSAADRQETTSTVVSHLERALERGGFRMTEERSARLLLVETYLRTGRVGDAMRILESDASDRNVDPEIRYLTVRALAGLNRIEEAEQTAMEGRRLHPRDPRFFRFLLRRDPLPGPEAGLWLDENASDHPAYLDSLLYYAARVGEPARSLELTGRYLVLGGQDPQVAVVRAAAMLESGGAGTPDATRLAGEWERFVRMGGLTDKDATTEMFELLPAGGVRARAEGVLSAYEGQSVRDEDHNGFWEERYTFENGVLVRWEIDADENGELEYDIELADRLPVRLATSPEGFRIEYGSYPEVASVSVVAELERRYRIIPGRLTYDIIARDRDWGADVPDPAFSVTRADRPPLLSEELLRRAAYSLEIAPVDGAVQRVLTLSGTTVLREVRDSDGNGRIDHVIAYRDGLPVSGMRDADGNGTFEITEQYLDGEPALLLVDGDDDGRVEYRERLQPERGYEWDYDEDGTVDARELVVGQGELLRQFSVDEDGAFELSMTVYREALTDE